MTVLREAIWRIIVCQLVVLVFASFFACARNVLCSPWDTDAWICRQGASAVPFSFSRRIIRLVVRESLMILFNDCSVDLTQALLAFRRTHQDWSEPCCAGWFSYSLAEGAVI